jgi:phosphate transport system substrate-binding protein
MSFVKLTASALAIAAVSATAAAARNQIQVAGSSTVLPYAQIVAEAFGENFPFPAPVVEGGGSGAGLQRMCEGVGPATIDIATSSRPIRAREFQACVANGVTDIMEVRIGYDGILFASYVGGPEFAFTAADVFNALAARVNVNGALVDNPHTQYSQFNPALPAQNILMLVPGTKHGTRDIFDDVVIAQGCRDTGAFDLILPTVQGADDRERERNAVRECTRLRADGRSIDIDGDYTETLARLNADRTAIGVFGLPFYLNNRDTLRAATFNGIVPSIETVAADEYPISRSLYLYVKVAHLGVIPGLQEFVEFFVSDEMAGPDGPLALYGLVSDPRLAETQELVRNRTPMAPL